MGKEWDKLAPAKTSANRGSTMNEPDPGPWSRGKRVSFYGQASRRNERCTKCAKWRISSNRCQCDEPDWEYRPRENAPPGARAMEQWHGGWLEQAYRVLQPGGVIKAFSGTRTYHRLAAAMEQAGFVEIRIEAWCYGSGFPKSLSVSKAIDKAAGVEREVMGFPVSLDGSTRRRDGSHSQPHQNQGGHGYGDRWSAPVTAPATEDAKRWDGWGTALKPSWEPVIVGRKPTL